MKIRPIKEDVWPRSSAKGVVAPSAKGLEERPPAVLASEMALTPASGSSVEPTQMGVMVGTLHYMSPEQASGRHDLLGPATDIFSLGALRYPDVRGRRSSPLRE